MPARITMGPANGNGQRAATFAVPAGTDPVGRVMAVTKNRATVRLSAAAVRAIAAIPADDRAAALIAAAPVAHAAGRSRVYDGDIIGGDRAARDAWRRDHGLRRPAVAA